jgi:hypothetical protein
MCAMHGVALLLRFIDVGQQQTLIDACIPGIAMVIMGGLTASSVHRLRKTWEGIGKASQQKFEELKEFGKSDANFGFVELSTDVFSNAPNAQPTTRHTLQESARGHSHR